MFSNRLGFVVNTSNAIITMKHMKPLKNKNKTEGFSCISVEVKLTFFYEKKINKR